MTIIALETTVLPPVAPLDDLLDLVTPERSGAHVELVVDDGRRIELPDEVLRVLAAVVSAMANGQAVTVAPHNQTLTTQEAADLLGVSRPTLVRILDGGELPYHQPGRHRRILLRDLLDYADERSHRQRAGLDELVAISEEGDMYEKTATPRRTR